MYKEMMDLKNKITIVTGGDGLLGKELCRGLGEFGATVIIGSNDKKNGLKVSKNLKTEIGTDNISYRYLNITSAKSIENFLSYILKEFGKVDILVNNAYPRNEKYGTIFENVEFKSFNENVISHMGGYFQVCQKIAQQMIKQKSGVIVNIGSIYGVLGPDFSIYDKTNMTMPVEYSLVKGGIINFTRYLATYLAPYNIRVNTISPGGIFHKQPAIFVERYCQRIPQRRMAKAEDIVGSLIFLVSDASEYITGQNIMVDGGLSVW